MEALDRDPRRDKSDSGQCQGVTSYRIDFLVGTRNPLFRWDYGFRLYATHVYVYFSQYKNF